jgi:hypothetical protein
MSHSNSNTTTLLVVLALVLLVCSGACDASLFKHKRFNRHHLVPTQYLPQHYAIDPLSRDRSSSKQQPPCLREQAMYCPHLHPPFSPQSLFTAKCFTDNLDGISPNCRSVYNRWMQRQQGLNAPVLPADDEDVIPAANLHFDRISSFSVSGDGESSAHHGRSASSDKSHSSASSSSFAFVSYEVLIMFGIVCCATMGRTRESS